MIFSVAGPTPFILCRLFLMDESGLFIFEID